MNPAALADEHRLYDQIPTGIRPLARRRQVLALSGGGFRGLFTARILEHVESTFGGRVRDHFQLCVGTSAGALIAAAVAHGIEAAAIRQAFERHGPAIFKRNWFTPVRRIFRPPYGVVGLNQTLDVLFADRFEDLHVLGIGTAAPDPAQAEDGNPRRGGLRWLLSRRGLVQLTLGSQEDLSVGLAGLLAGERYLRVDQPPAPAQSRAIGLDHTGPRATTALLDLADRCFAGFQTRADFRGYFV